MDHVWWACVLNLIGSILFLAGSLPGLIGSSWEAHVRQAIADSTFALGSACFIWSSIALILMWKADDFGLTLLKQLNFAIKGGGAVVADRTAEGGTAFRILPPPSVGPPSLRPLHEHVSYPEDSAAAAAAAGEIAGSAAPASPPPIAPGAGVGVKKNFSTRGAVFIVIYCWFAFVAIVAALQRQERYHHSNHNFPLRQAWLMFQEAFIVSMLLLILVIHSVVTSVPNVQPYRAVLIMGRALCLIGAIGQTYDIIFFFVDPLFERPRL